MWLERRVFSFVSDTSSVNRIARIGTFFVPFLASNQGNDDACSCEDFSEPISREEIPGWMASHEANKARFKPGVEYDVVFLGDDVIEEMNGTWLNRPAPSGSTIADDFKKVFSSDLGGDLEGVALGIVGDSVRLALSTH